MGTLAYPTIKGGISVRLLDHICKSFNYKQWCNFRTKQSLWGIFLKPKYYERAHPVSMKYDTGNDLFGDILLAIDKKLKPIVSEILILGHVVSGRITG